MYRPTNCLLLNHLLPAAIDCDRPGDSLMCMHLLICFNKDAIYIVYDFDENSDEINQQKTVVKVNKGFHDNLYNKINQPGLKLSLRLQ